jgi:hypothetical protein
LDAASVDIYAFAGERCDRIVRAVLAQIQSVPTDEPA